MPNPESKRTGVKIAFGAVTAIVFVAIAILGVLYYQGHEDNVRRKAQAAKDIDPGPVSNAQARMIRPPAALQHEYVAYFRPMEDNQADVAIDAIAKDAKKNKLSLVITCHGDDVINAGKDMVEALAYQREQTLYNALIARGVDYRTIKSDWGDPAIKSKSNMTPQNPTCEIETALPADPTNP